jgi:peptide/nickel transport system substrate-binding protein
MFDSMDRIVRVLSYVAILCLLGLTVAGCGAPRPSEDSGNGRLYVVLGGDPTSRDPLSSFDELSDAVLVNVFQSVLDPAAPEAYSACSSWSNPDPRTWDLSVKKGLRFHDGTELNADDVAASLRAAMADRSSVLNVFLAPVEAVQVQAPYVVRLKTRDPANLITGLSFVPVLPGGHRPDATAIPRGSGPYSVVNWERGRRIVLQHFVQGAGTPGTSPREVVFVPSSGAEAQMRLLKGLKPVVGAALLRDIRRRADEAGLRVITAPGKSGWYLICNLRKGHPTARRSVRLALAASVDAGDLARELGIPDLPADDIAPPGVLGWRAGRFRPDSSWDSGDRPSRPLRLVAMETVRRAAVVVAEQLRARGWEVTLTIVPVQEALQALKGDGWDLSLLGFTCATGDAMELYEFAFTPESSGVGGSFSCFRNSLVAERIAAARRALDPAVRLRAVQAVGDALVQELPWIPLVTTDRWAVLGGPVKIRGELPPRLWLTRLEVGR